MNDTVSHDRSRRIRFRGDSINFPLLTFVIIFFLSAVLFSLGVHAGGKAKAFVEIKDIRSWSASESVRIVVALSGPVEFTRNALSNPARLFLDIRNAKTAKGLRARYAVAEKFLKTVRVGQYSSDTVRIVFDLDTTEYDVKVLTLEDPPRLVIDLLSRKPVKDNTDIGRRAEEANTDAGFLRKRVVIDPGHGGEDPGAVGFRGLREKDVVLDIAHRVREIMKKEFPEYDVILTREKDYFVPLNQRAKIAEKHNADLFVSIHANASPRRDARGIETYLLNWTDDAESMRVAARENAISVRKMKEIRNEVGFLLASLDREIKRDESVKLAGCIQNSLVTTVSSSYTRVMNLGVKQALFYVLVDAHMPSALVEVSFVSNPDEERRLGDQTYRQTIASSIAHGIKDYFSIMPSKKIASARNEGREDRMVPAHYSKGRR